MFTHIKHGAILKRKGQAKFCYETICIQYFTASAIFHKIVQTNFSYQDEDEEDGVDAQASASLPQPPPHGCGLQVAVAAAAVLRRLSLLLLLCLGPPGGQQQHLARPLRL